MAYLSAIYEQVELNSAAMSLAVVSGHKRAFGYPRIALSMFHIFRDRALHGLDALLHAHSKK